MVLMALDDADSLEDKTPVLVVVDDHDGGGHGDDVRCRVRL